MARRPPNLHISHAYMPCCSRHILLKNKLGVPNRILTHRQFFYGLVFTLYEFIRGTPTGRTAGSLKPEIPCQSYWPLYMSRSPTITYYPERRRGFMENPRTNHCRSWSDMTVRTVVTKTGIRESKNRLVIFDPIKITTIRSAHHIRLARHITYAVLVYHIHRLSRLKT